MLARTAYSLRSMPAIARIAGELRAYAWHMEQSICLLNEPAAGSEMLR